MCTLTLAALVCKTPFALDGSQWRETELVGLLSPKWDISIIPTVTSVQEHRGIGGKNVRAGGWEGVLGDAVV